MKKICVLLTLFITCLGFTTIGQADDFSVSAKHAIALEVDTGKILYEKDATTSDGIASITKLLTAYMVYQAVERGEITMESPVSISDYAYNLTVNSNASNVPLEARQYTVQQLLEAALIASANSASIALAEKVAGSEVAFVERMKVQLIEWGITDATIINVSGLNSGILDDSLADDQKATENKMSAKDVAILARHLLQDYPQILEITKKATLTFDGQNISTYNYMLEGYPYYRPGVDGLKTGSSEVSGASFVATTNENGMRIITVILGADNSDQNDFARFEATNSLMNYVYQNFKPTTLVKKGETYQDTSVTIKKGKTDKVLAVAEKDLTVVTKISDTANAKLLFKADKNPIVAPVNKQEKLGTLTYQDSEKETYIDGQVPSVTMLTKSKVDRAFFLVAWWSDFVDFVNEKL